MAKKVFTPTESVISRAKGCFMGQVSGDSLGSLVESMTPQDIIKTYPDGIRELENGGVWDTLAGQPTDDSELAIILARTIIRHEGYDQHLVKDAYKYWLDSSPFVCRLTVSRGLVGDPDYASLTNGALMRVSPLGIYGAGLPANQIAAIAREDAIITHPNPICQQYNQVYVMALSLAIKDGLGPEEIYEQIEIWAKNFHMDQMLQADIKLAKLAPPEDYCAHQDFVRIAFHNALWQLLHAESFEAAVVDTVMQGGDTDTNAAICGALLGAIYGYDAIPKRWKDAVLNCRPSEKDVRVINPRPRAFWPTDILDLAEQLITLSCSLSYKII